MKTEPLEGKLILNKNTKQVYRLGKVMSKTVEFLSPITQELEGIFMIERLKNEQWVELKEQPQ